MRVLFITDRLPYPPVSGNLLRTYHLSTRLASSCELWMATPMVNGRDEAGLAHMQGVCHRLVTAPRLYLTRLKHLPGLLRHALHGKPLEQEFEYCRELAEKIRKLTDEVDFDVIHFEPSYVAFYREAVSPKASAKQVLAFHNVEAKLFARQAYVEKRFLKRLRTRLHSCMLERWEAKYASHFDRCVTVSEEDRCLLLEANPRLTIAVLPNGVDIKGHVPLPQFAPLNDDQPGLVFVGSMNYEPCVEAMLYFCREVFPRVREVFPGLQMWIVGREPTRDVKRLAGDGVHVTGWVEDVRTYYERSSVCVVPLRAGGGTRLKILEAMALGRPVISTTVGCEGLRVIDGEHIIIADSTDAFVKGTVRMLKDNALRRAISKRARERVVELYDWDAIAGDLLSLYAATM